MMAKVIGQKFSEMRNKVFAELLQNKELLKAIVVESEDYLNESPTQEQLELLKNPSKLIRNYIYPYKKMFDTVTEKKVIISSELTGFKKQGRNYRDGFVTFYILSPTQLEKTKYGLRNDCIGDLIEEIFTNTTIGELHFADRGDIDIGDNYIGHYITFKVTEFHIVRQE
jgi:hypothetical protein